MKIEDENRIKELEKEVVELKRKLERTHARLVSLLPHYPCFADKRLSTQHHNHFF